MRRSRRGITCLLIRFREGVRVGGLRVEFKKGELENFRETKNAIN